MLISSQRMPSGAKTRGLKTLHGWELLDWITCILLTTPTILEAGWMSILRDVVTDFYSETLDNSSSFFLSDTALNNYFTYAQQTHAGYVTFGQERKSFGFKAGLRLEQTITDAELVTTGDKFDNDYLSLFPSLHISKKFSPVKQMQLSYSRRINRPQLEFAQSVSKLFRSLYPSGWKPFLTS